MILFLAALLIASFLFEPLWAFAEEMVRMRR